MRDLLREDVLLFISNPLTESASYTVYRQTLERIAAKEGLSSNSIVDLLECSNRVHFGELIHHREAPQAVADGRADIAVVYDHLALRYTRIFPTIFDRVPLAIGENNITTRYAIGLVDESCEVANNAFQHFLGDESKSIYQSHGLPSIQ